MKLVAAWKSYLISTLVVLVCLAHVSLRRPLGVIKVNGENKERYHSRTYCHHVGH